MFTLQTKLKESKSYTDKTNNHSITKKKDSRDESRQITTLAIMIYSQQIMMNTSQIPPITVWSIQADCSVYTHFPRKICTVEFGVVLAGLHRFVWKFPLLPNEEVRNAFHDKEHRTFYHRNTHRCQLGWGHTVKKKALITRVKNTQALCEDGGIHFKHMIKHMQMPC